MYFSAPRALAVAALACGPCALAQTITVLPAVTVTGSREETLLSETPSAVGIIAREAIAFTRPSHPQQILGQIPGVALAVTNGEGHTTAIRQGFTTSPMYLFLEDGIPVRATGNFNHNALYELNMPSAGGVEVVRGIGPALYGSDAIGGIVNVLSRLPTSAAGADLSIEGGSFGWGRVLGGIDSGRIGSNAVRADINLTHTDGWREKTAYDRQSLNLRWDHEADPYTVIKTIMGMTKIDQQTGANSALPYDLYMDNPTINLRSPAYRKVDAFRLSSAIEKELGQGQQLTITPYFRDNRMDLNGSYNFSSSARIENTAVQSFGLMTKFRKNFDDRMRTRFIAGLDIDHSPSERREDSITLSSTGAGLYKQYTGYTIGNRIYDYKVVYESVAPYAQLETSPVAKLRLVAGLRYDYARFALDNRLGGGGVVNGLYQVNDTTVDFARLSPKLGMTWALTSTAHIFASYNQGFRSPSESQLFRSGGTVGANGIAQAEAALALKPILADQFEVGLRDTAQDWSYEVVAYVLNKKNDLLGRKDDTDAVVQTNNGTTQHKGIELGLGRPVSSSLRVDLAASYAKHRYVDWAGTTSGGTDYNYSGNEIESSPRLMGNMRLTWRPSIQTEAQLEWVKLGSYYLDAANAYGKYAGHNLFNVRLSHRLDQRWLLFARIANLMDKRFADSASATSSGALYSPGLPRAVYLGMEAKW
jgi:outer membrane receptor protein involved in Fe transport